MFWPTHRQTDVELTRTSALFPYVALTRDTTAVLGPRSLSRAEPRVAPRTPRLPPRVSGTQRLRNAGVDARNTGRLQLVGYDPREHGTVASTINRGRMLQILFCEEHQGATSRITPLGSLIRALGRATSSKKLAECTDSRPAPPPPPPYDA